MKKPIEELSGPELSLLDTQKHIEELNQELMQIRTVVNEIFVKASMSHSLIIVRKISEHKISDLEDLLG